MIEIKEALSKLQNRPWEAKKGAGWFVQLGEAIAIVEQPAVVGMKIEEDTAKFIAKSPEYVASLLSKVEEMQKVLQQTRAGISNAYEFGYLKETDQNDVHNMIERINEVLKGESQ